jgi:MarR-like DNA-binding transcriptional regulator SgrR of sgrS sRNA
MAPTNAHISTKISSYTQWTTYFGQQCLYHQGYKLQSLDILKVWNEIIKIYQNQCKAIGLKKCINMSYCDKNVLMLVELCV